MLQASWLYYVQAKCYSFPSDLFLSFPGSHKKVWKLWAWLINVLKHIWQIIRQTTRGKNISSRGKKYVPCLGSYWTFRIEACLVSLRLKKWTGSWGLLKMWRESGSRLSTEFLSWRMDLAGCVGLVAGVAGSCRHVPIPRSGNSQAWIWLPDLIDAHKIAPVLFPPALGSVCRIRPQEGLRCEGQPRRLHLALWVLGKMRVCFSNPKLPASKTSLYLPMWAFSFSV